MNNKKKVIILGAGVAGLAMGYFLCRRGQYDVTVLEKSPAAGGLCASFQHNGFTLDYGAHKLYSAIPGILDEIRALMGDRLIRVSKRNRIFLQNHLLDYPLKFGNLFTALGPLTFLRLGAGYGVSLAQGLMNHHPPRSYAEYMTKCFGRPTYQLIFEPLAEKVWGDPEGLHPELARTRVPTSNGLDLILKLLGMKKESADTNAEFFYYPRRGFGDFPQKLKEEIDARGGRVVTGATIDAFGMKDAGVETVHATIGGSRHSFKCDYLISTIPLPALSRLVSRESASHAADDLQFRHLILVYLFVKQPFVLEDQWIFFPEREFLFSRVFEQKRMNPELGPRGETAICCDFTCSPGSWAWEADDEDLAKRCVTVLKVSGFIRPDAVKGFLVKKVPQFYPRYDLQYPEKMRRTAAELKRVENLLLTGRLGMYNYNNSDHCFDMARFISEKLQAGMMPREIWSGLEERVKSYKIVD